MLIRHLIRCLVVTAAVVAASCGGYGSSSPTSPTSPSTNSGSTITIGRGVSNATTNAFGANPLTVPAGATITWTNGDTVRHTSTANAGTWNSGDLAPGASFSVTLSTPGAYPYRCNLHPNMVGTITVQ